MDPRTLQLILFAEQMAGLAAKTIMDLRNVLSGASTKAIDDILDDADATYNKIIADAKLPPA
jgi:hypothetical protein